MDILAIAGSLRQGSYNRQLAEAAGAALGRLRPEAGFQLLAWDDVPLMNQDTEHPAPAAVARVRDEVKRADGLWLFSPEYNHAIPGPLKNLIDWLSRPVSEAEGQVLAGKPVALAGASIGMSGAAHAQEPVSYTHLGRRRRRRPSRCCRAGSAQAWWARGRTACRARSRRAGASARSTPGRSSW